MKHILSIQDLSCVGRCSLTVALPVLSTMGHQCSVLPTAVLSTHTAFPAPEVADLTDRLAGFSRHWWENGVAFDMVSVGYLSDPRQAEIVAGILDEIGSFTVLDPVMGNNGKLYRRITPDHIGAMKQLAARADVLLPNLTEAAALAGLPYREQVDEGYLAQLTEGLLALGAKAVVITGVHLTDGAIGYYGRDREGDTFSYQGERIPRQFHGTGDLYAAAFAGCWMGGKSMEDAAAIAADFACDCIRNTLEDKAHWYGTKFETALPALVRRLYS